MSTHNSNNTTNMNVKLTTVTPEWAEETLIKNIGNRPLNIKHVDKLAKEMTEGRWKVNGDTICLNGSRVIDGQHRLHAVVQSGITIETLVVEGLPTNVFDTKDVGKRRSAGDTLGVAGEQNGCRLAAALVLIDKYFTGRVDKSVSYSNTEMEELLVKYPESRQSLQTSMGTKGLIPPSVLDACHYLFSRKDPVLADQFVDKVLQGTSLTAGSPWYVLRERLVNNSMSKAKLKKAYLMALCIKAWNNARSGTTLKLLKFSQEGGAQENFPIVQ
jgi:hypothetical protein